MALAPATKWECDDRAAIRAKWWSRPPCWVWGGLWAKPWPCWSSCARPRGRDLARSHWRLYVRFQDRPLLQTQRTAAESAYISADLRYSCRRSWSMRPLAQSPAEGRESLNEHRGDFDQPVKAGGVSSALRCDGGSNSVATTFFFTSFVVALIPSVWLLWVVIARLVCCHPIGLQTHRCAARCQSNSPVVYHALYSTLVKCSGRQRWSKPLGLMTAVYLVEYGTGRMSR